MRYYSKFRTNRLFSAPGVYVHDEIHTAAAEAAALAAAEATVKSGIAYAR